MRCARRSPAPCAAAPAIRRSSRQSAPPRRRSRSGAELPIENRLAVAGRTLPRLDARAKVPGSQHYGADVVLPGMLWGKLLRSPVPAAAIRRLDPRPARAIDGVRVVVTADDI